jgi:polyhydroxybutyrate depolymerase
MEQYLEAGGRRRRFLVRTPRERGAGPWPVMVNLHGSTSNPEEQLALSGMIPVADREGLVLVAPASVGEAWNVPADPDGPDEVDFIAEVLDRVQKLIPVDRTRIYATGFSGGGRLASHLASVFPDRFAAVAPVAGLRAPAPSGRAVPLIGFHGTADPINPYDGGGPGYWQTGVEQALEVWRVHHCGGEPERERVSETCERRIYRRDGIARLVFYRLDGAGHQWPGSTMDIGPAFGPLDRSIAASQLIWEFCREHRLPHG